MTVSIGRILGSLALIVFVGAVAVSATGAFFSDTETSTGNTFTAGSLDLKVDSEAHYNGLVCKNVGENEYRWIPVGGLPGTPEEQALDHYNQPCKGTWAETDLGPTHKFFDLHDVKPGDEGENTISLHVYNNDAWGRFTVGNVKSLDNSCTEPETEAEPGCANDNIGELHQNVEFWAWLDQGTEPGFQCQGVARCEDDPEEGDNIYQSETEPVVIQPGTVNLATTSYDIWPALAAVRANTPACIGTPSNGNNAYGMCHGLADDGRMVGSTTYYFGLAWSVPTSVGNEAQTDSLEADLAFQVVQHRNNPGKNF